MNWLRRFLSPPQQIFLPLLVQQGENAGKSVAALRAYLKKPTEKKFQEARQIEKDADEVHRILVHELEDTFVTPLDREDIFALSRAIDNFIDYVWDTVDEMEILNVPPLPATIAIADLLAEMAAEMELAIKHLLDYPRVANEHARRVKKLENEVEDAYRHAVNELFDGPESVDEIMLMLKIREVLRHVSNAADQGDKAADIIMDIRLKWT